MEQQTIETPKTKGFSKTIIIFVLSLALTIIILDSTLLNVSLSSIIHDFHTDIQSIQWVITAYSLTLAALTITGGRFGDLFGRKKMFVLGAIIFAIGSFISSISQNVGQMIIGESLIEGVGAALMMPATASLLIANFQGKERRVAFGIWGGIAGAAAALGPILGGFLSTNYSWRWGFRINIFIVILLVIGSLVIPESEDTEEKREIDIPGILLSSLGLLSVVFGVIESSTYGWWKAKEAFSLFGITGSLPGNLSVTPYGIIIGLILLALFILWELSVEKRGNTPLVSMKLFRNRQFVTGVLTTLVLSLGQSGLIFTIPVFLQAVRGYDPLQTGLSLLPMSLMIIIVSPLAAFLSGKFPPKYLVNIGLILNVLAVFVLRSEFSSTATTWSLAPGMVLFGAGMGLVMSQINNLTLSAVSVQEAGEASGVNNTLRQVGASFGAAILGAILIGGVSTNLSNGVQSSSILPDYAKSAISQEVIKQSSNIEFGSSSSFAQNIPQALLEEITRISHQAIVDADKESLLIGSFFTILGFLVSLALPNVKQVEKSESLAVKHED